tara:strand:- start:14 stop:676 length:663 start_codon:yes stop_codon:yes gene_type:complete
MINKMCKTGGFELPHMSPLKVKKLAEEKLQEFDRTPKKLDIKEPGGIKMEGPINFGHPTNSSGGDPEQFKYSYRDSVAGTIKDPKLAEFIKNQEVIDNPEYASYTKGLNPDTKLYGDKNFQFDGMWVEPAMGGEAEAPKSSEYDFFVKHRTPESDSLAYRMMNLNEEMTSARMNKDSEKVRELMDKQKNLRSVIKNAGTVMEEGGKSEYLEDKMNFRGEL